jgi:hypothetical protein
MSAVQIAVRHATQAEVVAAVLAAGPHRHAFVSPPVNGWVSVFDLDAEEQWDAHPADPLLELAALVSRATARPSIALRKHDGRYWVVDRDGRVADEASGAFRNGETSPGDILAVERVCRFLHALADGEYLPPIDPWFARFSMAHWGHLCHCLGLPYCHQSYSGLFNAADALGWIPDGLSDWPPEDGMDRFAYVGSPDPRGTVPAPNWLTGEASLGSETSPDV